MNELPAAGSWFACPRCNRAPLAAAAAGHRCDACGTEFPLVGGIPWLFAEPQAQLGEWRGRTASTLQALRSEHGRLAAAAAAPDIGALTRRRLARLAGATLEHAAQLERLLAPLGAAPAPSAETLLAFRPSVAWDQGLMTYAYNVHRDWSWGAAENEASFAIARDALAGEPPGRILVLGAGAGRLAYDLHMRTAATATLVLDFNPFLLLLARAVTAGQSVTLYEFPHAPKTLDDCAVLRELAAERACRQGLHFVLADAERPPFAPASFDTVVTPWLVDILPEPFTNLCRRINALLRTGGRWINFGSLAFHVADPKLKYSPEECGEIIEAAGFADLKFADETIPYLTSPASRHGRVEQVLCWSATKRRDTLAAERPALLPAWLTHGRDAVPLLEVFRTQAPATQLRGFILSLIDGRRSLHDIVAIFDRQRLMPHDQAEAMIRGLLLRMYQSQ